jgi:hypothetical protein
MNQQERDEYLEMDPVGEGWMPIVRELDRKLSEVDPNYTIEQIKEKFGGLRYYYRCDNDKNDELYALVKEAEALCWETCEDCGAKL